MPFPQPHVLCVDDNEDSRELLSMLLISRGIATTNVATATDALTTIKRKRFDLYLLDGWLPDLDGVELCRLMRARDPDTPILFFSGAAYEADKKRAIDAGASAYVVKPDIESLLESVTNLIQIKTRRWWRSPLPNKRFVAPAFAPQSAQTSNSIPCE